jgi:hypothetical protein
LANYCDILGFISWSHCLPIGVIAPLGATHNSIEKLTSELLLFLSAIEEENIQSTLTLLSAPEGSNREGFPPHQTPSKTDAARSVAKQTGYETLFVTLKETFFKNKV